MSARFVFALPVFLRFGSLRRFPPVVPFPFAATVSNPLTGLLRPLFFFECGSPDLLFFLSPPFFRGHWALPLSPKTADQEFKFSGRFATFPLGFCSFGAGDPITMYY